MPDVMVTAAGRSCPAAVAAVIAIQYRSEMAHRESSYLLEVTPCFDT
jgi:hypothetical protein